MGDGSPNNSQLKINNSVTSFNYLKSKVESIFGISNQFWNDTPRVSEEEKGDDNCSVVSDSNNNDMNSNNSELCEENDTVEDHLEDMYDSQELPSGSAKSGILDERMIRQLLKILPSRAVAYPWVNVYNTALHGFSLATLYRKMDEWEVDMSPMLLLVNDMDNHVFGAFTSSKLRHSERYYGTGDATFLFRFIGDRNRRLETYRWTGVNEYFICSPLEFFSIGGGNGVFGLWLDADLNRGQSRKCDTFDNAPLAGDSSGFFNIQNVEVFGFCTGG